MALLLRAAGVAVLAAVSEDYPGSLLDHRRPYHPEWHEVEQNLDVMKALGFELPKDQSDHLAIDLSSVQPSTNELPLISQGEPYVALHADASVPARSIPHGLAQAVEIELLTRGWTVVLTGGGPPHGMPCAGRGGASHCRDRQPPDGSLVHQSC